MFRPFLGSLRRTHLRHPLVNRQDNRRDSHLVNRQGNRQDNHLLYRQDNHLVNRRGNPLASHLVNRRAFPVAFPHLLHLVALVPLEKGGCAVYVFLGHIHHEVLFNVKNVKRASMQKILVQRRVKSVHGHPTQVKVQILASSYVSACQSFQQW